MSDFSIVTVTHINTWMRGGIGLNWQTMGAGNSPGSTTWAVANSVTYVPFYARTPYVVRRVFWVNGSAAGGNLDIGLYSPGGSLIWNAGSTAGSGNNVLQYVTPSSEILLTPGPYFVALVLDNITANRIHGSASATLNQGRALGVYTQVLGGLPLPSTATFSAYVAGTVIPTVGITNTTTGF